MHIIERANDNVSDDLLQLVWWCVLSEELIRCAKLPK